MSKINLPQKSQSHQPTPGLRKACTTVQRLIKKIRASKDPRPVFDHVATLASLPANEYAKFKIDFKKILGNKLSGADLDHAVREARKEANQTTSHGTGSNLVAQYEVTREGIIWHKPTANGSVPVRLTNFTARILTDVLASTSRLRRRSSASRGSLTGRRLSRSTWR